MGSRTGAADLTTRLNKGNVHHIYQLINNGYTLDHIRTEYPMSYSSLVRILTKWEWSEAQRHHWDFDSIGDLVWPPDTKRPKATYPPNEPIPEVKPGKAFTPKGTEYSPGGEDAAAYLDAQKSNEPPEVDPKMLDLMDKANEEMDNILENSPTEKYLNTLPHLDSLYPTARDQVNHKEILHRMESVELCFDLMAEEFAKLQVLINK